MMSAEFGELLGECQDFRQRQMFIVISLKETSQTAMVAGCEANK
jgi:hypothetical protein